MINNWGQHVKLWWNTRTQRGRTEGRTINRLNKRYRTMQQNFRKTTGHDNNPRQSPQLWLYDWVRKQHTPSIGSWNPWHWLPTKKASTSILYHTISTRQHPTHISGIIHQWGQKPQIINLLLPLRCHPQNGKTRGPISRTGRNMMAEI